MKRILSLYLFLSLPILLIAQKTPSIAVGFSANSYNGELSNYSSWSQGFQVTYVLNAKKKLAGTLNAGIASITGSDREFSRPTNASDPTPNTFVKTNYIFANYGVRFTFLNIKKVSAYLGQGIGFMRFNPKDDLDNDLIEQDDSRAEDEDYRNISFMLPTSLGINYLFENDFDT